MNEVKPRPAFSPSNDVVVLEAEICLDFYKLRPETRKQTFTQENCKHGGCDMGSGGRGGGCNSANFIYGITPHIKLYLVLNVFQQVRSPAHQLSENVKFCQPSV